MGRKTLGFAPSVMATLILVSPPLLAQITTGTIAGSVKDPTGAVIPGATVVLISETRGTKSAPVVTRDTGDYVFPAGLATVHIDREADTGEYWEPNIWIIHEARGGPGL